MTRSLEKTKAQACGARGAVSGARPRTSGSARSVPNPGIQHRNAVFPCDARGAIPALRWPGAKSGVKRPAFVIAGVEPNSMVRHRKATTGA
jgi:hypothetical protein